MNEPQPGITALLAAWQGGDRAALDQLIPLVESELRGLARRYMRPERPGHTLQTTSLINEAYIRLAGAPTIRLHDRAHFFGIAARLMRQILVDHARADWRLKRGGGAQQVDLNGLAIMVRGQSEDLLRWRQATRMTPS